MRLEQLAYIIEIADSGSFTTASERLFIAQPSVSQAVTALEQELNIILFSRSRQGAEPTEIGRQVIAHARKVMDQVNEIKKLSGINYDEIRSILTIGAVPTMCSTILPKAVSAYKKRFPNVVVRIQEGGTRRIRQGVSKGSMDLGLVSHHEDGDEKYDPEYFCFHPLISGKLIAYVRRQSPLARHSHVTFSDLAAYPVILFGEEFSLSAYVLNKLKQYGAPNVLSSTSNPESIKKFVMETDSVGFGPDISLVNDPYVQRGDIIPLHIDVIPAVQFGILKNNQRSMGVAADELAKELTLQANIFNRLNNLI